MGRKITVNSHRYAGYAALKNVLAVFSLLHSGSLPSVLYAKPLIALGIPTGDVYPLLLTLRCLRLIDEQGQVTQVFHELVTASPSLYQDKLLSLLRKAYPDIFARMNPALATYEELLKAFSDYKPAKQHAKMVALFRGLCVEAGLIIDEPQEMNKRQEQSFMLKLVRQLPTNGKWTQERRERWLQAVSATVDLMIEVEEAM